MLGRDAVSTLTMGLLKDGSRGSYLISVPDRQVAMFHRAHGAIIGACRSRHGRCETIVRGRARAVRARTADLRARLSRRGQLLADAAAAVVAAPAETGLVWLRGERRPWKVAGGELQVVLHRREVVRTVGMEERGQVLQLPTSRP